MRLQIPTGLTAVMASFDRALSTLACLGPELEDLLNASFCAKLEFAQRQLVLVVQSVQRVRLVAALAQTIRQARSRASGRSSVRRAVRPVWQQRLQAVRQSCVL